MTEQWIQWTPCEDLHGKYMIKKLTADANGLIVDLYAYNGDNHIIEVACKPYAQASRYNSKQWRLHDLCNQLSKSYGEEFHKNWTFFKVLDSEYLEWLDDESGTVSSYCGIMHFCVLAENGVVDIGTDCAPIVRTYTMQ